MKKFTFSVEIDREFGEEVYITTSGRKTWMKGVIKGWTLGHTNFPVECKNEHDEERYQRYPLPISYIVTVTDPVGNGYDYKRPSSSVFDKPAEEDIARLKKLKEQKQKLEDEIKRIEQYL